MNHTEILKKLIGPVSPVGETNEDDRRFENLQAMCVVANDLIVELNRIAIKNKRASEYSVKRAGEYADNCLKNITDALV